MKSGIIEPRLTKPETAKLSRFVAELTQLIDLDTLQQLSVMNPMRTGIKESAQAVRTAATATTDAIAALVGMIGCDAPEHLPLLDDQPHTESGTEAP